MSDRRAAEGHAADDRPLAGLVVLDLAQFLAGPSCALRLADLGADVIKVERPDGGDACRSLYVADQAFGEDSALFHFINRGKRSFAADLKDPRDLARVRRLVARADVLISSFRPGAMERLGLGYDALRELNPRLVCATVSGYGQSGPWAARPGQDLLVQSLSGMVWLSGEADRGPVPTGMSVADITTGAHLTQGVLAALVRRAATGRGGRVEVSLMASAIDLQFEQFSTWLNGDAAQQPARSRHAGANVHAAAPYGIYETADGHLAIAMTPVDQLAVLLGSEALSAYADPSMWFAERDAIKAILMDVLMSQATRHWLDLLEPAGVWCAEVLDWPRLRRTEAFEALDMIQGLEGPGGEALATTRCPIELDGRRPGGGRRAPRLGEHTDEIARAFDLVPAAGGEP